jgi:retinoid hydroxylase
MIPATLQLPRVQVPPEASEHVGHSSYLARLSLEFGPIFTMAQQGGGPHSPDVVYLVGPEANRFVLFTHREHFSHSIGWDPVFGRILGKGLINMDPPEHQRHRALMNPAFTTGFMNEYLPVMCQIIADRTRDWASRGQIDLTGEAREIAFDIAAAALLGLKTGAEVDFLRERFYELFRQPGSAQGNWVQFLLTIARVRSELDGKLLELIAARRNRASMQPAHNVLDMLVDARDEQGNPLSEKQLLGHLNILLVAGHETTTNLSAWLIYLLSTHPEYGARVEAELAGVFAERDTPITNEALHNLPILTNAMFEAGRLHPPVMFLPRGVLKSFEFGGYTVSAGTSIVLAIAASHRLPTVFERPDIFDPDRFLPPREEHKRHPYALATYGGGPRTCLGINFADMEVKSLVAHLWRRYRFTPIPGLEVVEVDAIVQCLPEGICVHVTDI